MLTGTDRIKAVKVIARMRDDEASVRSIQDVLQIQFPNAPEEDILLLVAEYIKNNPPFSKSKPHDIKRSLSHTGSENSGSCSSSSTPSASC